jgi:hypothetical protein
MSEVFNNNNSEKDVEVTISINSSSGDDKIVTNVAEAVKILKEQVSKFGKWLYVGKQRFRLDPNSDSSLKSLAEAITSTPRVRVTGSLRGGEPSLKELRMQAKQLGLKKYSKLNKEDLKNLINNGQNASQNADQESKDSDLTLRVSSENSGPLDGEGKGTLLTISKDEKGLIMTKSEDFEQYKVAIASLISSQL